jgi:hypothetical protein
MRRCLPFGLVLLLTVAALADRPEAVQQAAAPAQAANLTAGVPGAKPWPDAAGMAERKREAERRRLFRSDETLAVTLAADFRAVMRDRDPKSVTTYPATITFPANDGTMTSMPLRIRTRGHSRRNPVTCTFSPLRLEFEKPRTKGTVFDGHGALKLGTHCRKGQEEIILRELAIYKAFNILTPQSFRARAANVTYVDLTGKQVAQEAGLFIEDDDDVAKRNDGQIIPLENAIFPRVDQETLTLMMLFEYMIGNTDLSVMVQHNVRLVLKQDNRRYPVPYDFDYSGLAESGYAAVGRGLPITSVRDRLYRGPCRTQAEWQPYLEKMKAAKPQIMAVFETLPGLSPSYRRSARGYLEEFYRNINSPSIVKRELIDTCIKVGM